MKRYICFTVAFLLLFSVSAFAATVNVGDLGLELGGEYCVITADNLSVNEGALEKTGHSVSSMKQYMNDNDLVVIAVDETAERQLQVFRKETDFSSYIGDLSLLDDDSAALLANQLIAVDYESELSLVQIENIKYFRISSAGRDSGGDFENLQYVTVFGGKLYNFSFYCKKGEENFSKQAEDIMMSVSTADNKKTTVSGAENITEIVIVSVLILLALCVTVFVLFTLVRDFLHKKDGGESIKIPRRK